MLETDDAPALPLWINGHAYLTMAPAFFDIRSAGSDEVLRRTPLCGAAEAAKAVDAAQGALPQWVAMTKSDRAALLAAVAGALEGYAGHFTKIIAEETGKDGDAAAAEVSATLSMLRDPDAVLAGEALSGVIAIISDDSAPLLGPLSLAVPALLSGATLVMKPSPKAPSALFALAELTARNGFPGGVFNILQGDLAAIEGLCAEAEVAGVFFAGDATIGARVGAIAKSCGKPFISRN